MPQSNEIEFFSVNCNFPGNRKAEEIGKSHFWKKKKRNCVIFVAILTVLIITMSLKFTNSSNVSKSKKIKRYIQVNDFNRNQDKIKTSKSDDNIVFDNLRKDQPGNRMYKEEVPEQTSKSNEKRLNGKISWSPEPRQSRSVSHHENFRKEILRGKLRSQKVRTPSKSQKKFPKHLGSPMRLKGIFIEPENSFGNHLKENYDYLKEINNLMQYNSKDEENRGEWPSKETLKYSGAPFQLSVKGSKSLKRQELNLTNLKKHPITIYLDFYPMNNSNEAQIGSTRLDAHTRDSVNPKEIFLPNGKQKGIIMKLNLYGKKSTPPKQGSKKNNKKAEKKTFEWFSKKKKEAYHPEECIYMGLNPNEKHITAKWIDKNGEWIHAKRVTLKYIKKKDKRKRK